MAAILKIQNCGHYSSQITCLHITALLLCNNTRVCILGALNHIIPSTDCVCYFLCDPDRPTAVVPESSRCCGLECIGPICIAIHSSPGLAVPKGIAGQNVSPINVRRLNGYCYPRIAMKYN